MKKTFFILFVLLCQIAFGQQSAKDSLKKNPNFNTFSQQRISQLRFMLYDKKSNMHITDSTNTFELFLFYPKKPLFGLYPYRLDQS